MTRTFTRLALLVAFFGLFDRTIDAAPDDGCPRSIFVEFAAIQR
jgi:hypothetical protein